MFIWINHNRIASLFMFIILAICFYIVVSINIYPSIRLSSCLCNITIAGINHILENISYAAIGSIITYILSVIVNNIRNRQLYKWTIYDMYCKLQEYCSNANTVLRIDRTTDKDNLLSISEMQSFANNIIQFIEKENLINMDILYADEKKKLITVKHNCSLIKQCNGSTETLTQKLCTEGYYFIQNTIEQLQQSYLNEMGISSKEQLGCKS